MDYEARRDPDAILRQIVEEEAAEGDTRGKLKIFFGYAAGVGKTYAMLEEAHAVLEKGFDVVVGYVEPHKSCGIRLAGAFHAIGTADHFHLPNNHFRTHLF